MSDLVVNFNAAGIYLTAVEDIPRCDFTIIQIRRTNFPSAVTPLNNPYVDLTHDGIVSIEFSNCMQYVDPGTHNLMYLRVATLHVIHITSMSKGTIGFISNLSSSISNKTLKVDQTPTVLYRANSTQPVRFVGNVSTKDQFVRLITNAFFAESKQILDQNPFP